MSGGRGLAKWFLRVRSRSGTVENQKLEAVI
jgi:hypothetical protein